MARDVSTCSTLAMPNFAPISLTDGERAMLEAICRRRKIEVPVWKQARAFILLDTREDPDTVCQILDIGLSVVMEWCVAYCVEGLAFLG